MQAYFKINWSHKCCQIICFSARALSIWKWKQALLWSKTLIAFAKDLILKQICSDCPWFAPLFFELAFQKSCLRFYFWSVNIESIESDKKFSPLFLDHNRSRKFISDRKRRPGFQLETFRTFLIFAGIDFKTQLTKKYLSTSLKKKQTNIFFVLRSRADFGFNWQN